MSRSIDTLVLNELSAESLRAFILWYFKIGSYEYRYTDCDVPLLGHKPHQIGNLITNGDMELDSNWSAVNTPETCERSSADKHLGTYSWHIIDNPASAGGMYQANIKIEKGKKYRYTTWYKVISGAIQIRLWESPGGKMHNVTNLTDSSWTKLTQIITAEMTNYTGSTYVEMLNASGSTAAEFYIDDVSIYEEEEMSNGTFDQDAEWNKGTGWSIANGVAHCDGSQTSPSDLYKLNVTNKYSTWQISLKIKNYSAGSLKFGLTGKVDNEPARSANGTFTQYQVNNWEYDTLYIKADANFIADIDDVQVKEVELYTPLDMKVQPIRYSATGIVDEAKIEAINLNEKFTALFVGQSIQGSASNIKLAILDSDYINVSGPEMYFDGEIDSWLLDEEKVKVTLINFLSQWQKKTINRHSPSCRYRVFKDTTYCKYSGGETWCDRSYARCQALGNTANFGGFYTLPDMVDKEIWWGQKQKL